MNLKANSVADYLDKVPEERKEAFNKLRDAILKNLPEGFSEVLSYGMIGYVVPLSTYPDGYHCDPKLPLPFLNIANQKNFLALYHMGIYADKELYDWFVGEYPKYVKTKLDMGKSCIRFKKMETIPFKLIGELISKMSMEKWVTIYEQNLRQGK
jgi:uncharacterized protein YdhG (YjbR/CyaY superfamily)